MAPTSTGRSSRCTVAVSWAVPVPGELVGVLGRAREVDLVACVGGQCQLGFARQLGGGSGGPVRRNPENPASSRRGRRPAARSTVRGGDRRAGIRKRPPPTRRTPAPGRSGR